MILDLQKIKRRVGRPGGIRPDYFTLLSHLSIHLIRHRGWFG
ncbi:MAG: hypothetical protein SGI83_18000 [Bacteroidota bacterium]|nr:hypothetical protein [Bacteroidota bacterium]